MTILRETHSVEIAGLRRELPLFEVAPGLRIAVLNILGDTELVQACARELAGKLSSLDYDLLVSIPLNMGDDVVARSGMGDDLNFIPVDKNNFLSPQYANIFVLGDAASLPTSKAGSVAHFAVECFSENFVRYIEGQEMLPTFDGHANCFIESGFGKGLLIDFNYDVEPLPGRYPLPGIGPFTLLQESEMNHWGKMMFRWMYWNILLKGQELPLPARMTMAGKWNDN